MTEETVGPGSTGEEMIRRMLKHGVNRALPHTAVAAPNVFGTARRSGRDMPVAAIAWALAAPPIDEDALVTGLSRQ